MALPVHAERRLRLRLDAGAGARRRTLERHAGKADDAGRTATASSTCSIAPPASSCSGKPFVKVNWASGLDENGRPIQTPQPPGAPTWPGNQGGTNWYSPSYSPRTGLFYVSAWENYGGVYRSQEVESTSRAATSCGGGFTATAAGARRAGAAEHGRRGPINNWTDAVGHGAVDGDRSRDRRARSGSSRCST